MVHDSGPAPTPVVKLVVDADRNGDLDDTGPDVDQHNDWSAQRGAMFLANLDDDDSDHHVDCEDDAVNGADDAEDLARIRTVAWPTAPNGAVGHLALDAGMAPGVRLFKLGVDGWAGFNPASDTVSAEELRAGVEFGVESTDFPSSTWNGQIALTWSVTAQGVTADADHAVMRVAPWVMSSSLDHTQQIFAVDASYPTVLAFTNNLVRIAEDTHQELLLIDGLNRAYREDVNRGPDVWAQDFMEFGWTAIPGPNSGRRGMFVVLRTPPATRLIGDFTYNEFLAPGKGVVWKRSATQPRGHDQSLDSFGNLEVIPPYTHGDTRWPLGRLMHGYTPARVSDPKLRDFLDANPAQGPFFRVDESWLHVGHVDEFLSFIPAATPRGWKLLVASPRLARQNLMALVARDPANGERLMFRNMHWFYPEGSPMAGERPAQRTVNAILADPDLMRVNQVAQAHIDTTRQQLMEETGITDAEIIEIPFLLWEIENNLLAAYMPGTVNLLLYGNDVVMARPHGVVIDGVDVIETDLIERLRPDNINVHFAEQWDVLHAAEGEVHCGTNALRDIPTNARWWEVTR